MDTKPNSNVLIFLLISLLGCGPSNGNGTQTRTTIDDDRPPSRMPTPEEMLQATGGGYKSPAGVLRECLGRLVFDVVGPPQWPTYINKDSTYLFSSKFGERLYDSGDSITVDNVRIAVIGPTTSVATERIRSGTPRAEIEWHEESIKTDTAYIEKLRAAKTESKKATQDEINDFEESIRKKRLTIDEAKAAYEDVPLPFADSDGFWRTEQDRPEWPRYSIYRVYLRRGEFTYVFESTAELTNEITKESHKERFFDLLKNFRPRNANEIPSDLGVCIPYGFIADRGELVTDIKQSMRWPDAPGVLYSVQTGNSTPKNTKAAYITAIGTAMAAKTKSIDGIKPILTNQIGPRLTKIGGLPASQGGFAMRIDERGKKSFEVYNVFTGYSGWWGTAVLPFILVEMSTRTIDQVSELKVNPPPFKQSMDRLEPLLRSMYIRPTNPLMPDFEAIQKQKR